MMRLSPLLNQISIRAPRKRCDYEDPRCRTPAGISIRAPRKRCDGTGHGGGASSGLAFQSAHLVRGGMITNSMSMSVRASFQSAHLVRGAMPIPDMRASCFSFQSAHLVRGAINKIRHRTARHRFQSAHLVRGAIANLIRIVSLCEIYTIIFA